MKRGLCACLMEVFSILYDRGNNAAAAPEVSALDGNYVVEKDLTISLYNM